MGGFVSTLPFRITSGLELFQCQMLIILEGLPRVLCLMDDIIIFGPNQEEHDTELTATLEQQQTAV